MPTKKPVEEKVEPKKAPAKKTVKDFAEKVAAKVKEVVAPVEAPEVALPPPSQIVVTVTHGPLTDGEKVREAWEQVRGPGDAPYEQCMNLSDIHSHADSIFKGNQPLQGDTQMARFEQALIQLNKEK